jgi:hypothetical protein
MPTRSPSDPNVVCPKDSQLFDEPGESNLVRCHRTDELARRAHVLLVVLKRSDAKATT